MFSLQRDPRAGVMFGGARLVRQLWRYALFGTGWILSRPTTTMAQLPAELRSADSLAAGIETGDFRIDLQAVDTELAKVRRYLHTHPTDAVAEILTVRLGWLRDTNVFLMADTVPISIFVTPPESIVAPTARRPQRPPTVAYQEILDGVLTRDSTVAAAHFWKARLLIYEAELAARVAFEQGQPLADSTALLPHLRRAVRYDPDNATYREHLAVVLSFADQLDEAAEVLRHPAMAGTALQVLVQDLLPCVPPGGKAQPFNPMQLLFLADDPGAVDYQWLRMHAWITEAPLDEVQAHYRARWPDIRFFAKQEPVSDEETATIYVAVLRLTASGWKAVRDSAEFERRVEAMRDVLVLMVAPPELEALVDSVAEKQGSAAGARDDRPNVRIAFMNARPWPAREPPVRSGEF